MRGCAIALDPAQTGDEAQSLQKTLERLIAGQSEAIRHIVSLYQMHITGLAAPGKPVGTLLFLGPTGSGKTRCVEAAAETLAGTVKAVVRVDCGEFQHSHEIAKLIGSPPGYLGHRETHPLLSQDNLNAHHSAGFRLSFVLFDEIEKASDAVWNLLLGILDKATLTLGDNRKVDFSQSLIFLTSNLGAAQISSALGSGMGFRSCQAIPGVAEETQRKISRAGIEAARRRFTPEFMNRLDRIAVFQPLGEAELKQVLDLELHFVQQRILQQSREAFIFTVTPPAKRYLLAEGRDARYGARHLKRAIERTVVDSLCNLVATGQIRGGDWIKVDLDADSSRLTYFREAEGLPAQAMSELSRTTTLGVVRPVPPPKAAGGRAAMAKAVRSS
jgi:ATP-dependent Clp protease ATP-binding subunit ClpA